MPAWALCRLCLNWHTHARQIRAALGRWDGSGAFVFTGSAGVYAEDGGGPCPEEGPVVAEGHSERTDRRALAWCSAHAQHSMLPSLVQKHRSGAPSRLQPCLQASSLIMKRPAAAPLLSTNGIGGTCSVTCSAPAAPVEHTLLAAGGRALLACAALFLPD